MWINVDRVRALFPSGAYEQNTTVAFDREHCVVAAGPVDRIAEALDAGEVPENVGTGEPRPLLRVSAHRAAG